MKAEGQDISQLNSLQARWMPTVFQPQKLTLKYDTEFLQLFNLSQANKLQVTQNVSQFVNWTECTLQTLYIMQWNKAQNDSMSNNELIWRTVFKQWIPTTHWILLSLETVQCTDYYCAGKITHFNVSRPSKLMCKFVGLPIILGEKSPFTPEFWLPHFEGMYLDTKNKTHNLDLCSRTMDGVVCGQSSQLYEPCLLEHSVHLCWWTILPSTFSMFIEIEPQHVYVVTSNWNTTQIYNLTTPFSGCLANVTHLY